jgi:hypothetical protein
MDGSISDMSETLIAIQFELLCQRDMEAAAHMCGKAVGLDFDQQLNAYNEATARWLDAAAVTRECRRLDCM